jgi:hypothetical protein
MAWAAGAHFSNKAEPHLNEEGGTYMNRTRLHVLQGKSAAPRLCDTCESAVVLRSAAANEDEVVCLVIGRAVAADIVTCNRYIEREVRTGAAAQAWGNAWVA